MITTLPGMVGMGLIYGPVESDPLLVDLHPILRHFLTIVAALFRHHVTKMGMRTRCTFLRNDASILKGLFTVKYVFLVPKNFIKFLGVFNNLSWRFIEE